MAAPSTYHASPNKQPSKRAVRDEQLKLEILRVWDQNYRVYGADKIWAQLNRLWLADITYVRTWDRLRLCLVRHRLLRPHDRRVAGVALAAHRPRS